MHTISIRLYHKGSLQSWIAPLQPVAVLIGGPLKLLCSCEWVICALYKCKSTTLTVYKQGSPSETEEKKGIKAVNDLVYEFHVRPFSGAATTSSF